MFNQIDIAIIQFVNSFAGHWSWFDRLILEIFQLNTFKMLPLVTLLVWLWFSEEHSGPRQKAVFNAALGGFAALFLTRLVQNLGPHRPRPALDGSFHFVVPAGGYTNDWSSFPSDTAGLAFALAFGIWLAHRRLGILALLWAVLVISFPRLYGGYHYLSDLIAGAMLGVFSTLFWARCSRVSDPLFNFTSRFATQHKAIFLAIAFILAFQTSTYFADIRKTGEKILHVIGVK